MKHSTIKKMRSIVILAALLLNCLLLAAQNSEFPAAGSYRLDTLRNKKWASQLSINLGVFGDVEGGEMSPTTGGAYLYARYHLLKRFSFALTTGMLPIKIGNVDLSKAYLAEGRVSINFGKKLEKSTENFKLGQDGDYKYSANVPISAGTLTGVTGSISVNKRMHTEKMDSFDNWKVTETKTGNTKTLSGQSVATDVFVQQIGMGFFYSRAINFKGRFFLTANSGWQRKMIRRKRSSIDMSLEFLIAPIIKVGETPILIGGKGDAALVNQYKIDQVDVKRTGWRAQIHVRRGIFAMYYELGGRPGVYFNMNDVKASDVKWYLRPMNGFYLRVGVGIGIGMLGTDK